MRVDEYTPTTDTKLGGGHADDYGRMIIEELKPLVDRTYRTRSDRDNTGIAGSSLGGLVSLHLAFRHPAVFGKVAALSPSVWWDRKAILKTVRQMRSKPTSRCGSTWARRKAAADLTTRAYSKRRWWDWDSWKASTFTTPNTKARRTASRHGRSASGPMLEWLFGREGSD